MPKRIQRKRTKGWRMPPNTIYVGRPTRWGNPFTLKDLMTVEECVQNYSDWLFPSGKWISLGALWIRAHIEELRGKNLACWCSLDQPCHADILLELANIKRS